MIVRHWRRWVSAAAVAGISVLAGAAVAEEPVPAQPLTVTQTDAAGYPEVAMTVGMPPGLSGRDIPSSAFTVVEGGERKPVNAVKLPGDDLEVVLVIDTSGSMKGAAMDAAKAAAVSFVQGMPPNTRVAVVSFGSKPGIASPFSVDKALAQHAIERLEARGETALYDAMRVALDLFTPTATGRRAMVLLSDGGDTASAAKLDDVVTKTVGARVRTDVVALQTSESDTTPLQRLAEAGGGRVVSVADPAALAAIYQQLAATISSEYRLTYRSSAHGETDVVVEVSHEGAAASANVHLSLPVVPAPPAAPQPLPAPAADVAPVPAGPKPLPTKLLFIGLGAFFASFLIFGLLAFLSRPRRAASLLPASVARRGKGSFEDFAVALSKFVDKLLERWGQRRSLSTRLEEAGLALRPGEFSVLTLSAAVVLAAIGFLFWGVLPALAGGLMAVLGARGVLSVLASRRRAKFSDQLGDTLQLMSSGLRAGYAFLQAVDAVARELPSPTCDEFRRLVIETRLGRDMSESLRAMAKRVGGDDFEWVVQAIEINREVGGDLAEVLDNIGTTIRERNQLRRHVRALTAEGRLSAYILLALPFVLALGLKFINPSYFDELTHKPGIALVGVAGVFMVAGAIWLKKLVKLVY